jgi:hypothetical protein
VAKLRVRFPWAKGMSVDTRIKLALAGVVVLTLLLLPAPLLPPHRVAEGVQSLLGVSWMAAYFLAAMGLYIALYSSLGAIAVFALPRASTRGRHLLQLVCLPPLVAGVALIMRIVKLGFVPVLGNALIPLLACFLGAAFGTLFISSNWRPALAAIGITLVGLGWALFPSSSSALSRETEAQLRELVANARDLPSGDGRLGILFRTAFAPLPENSKRLNPVAHNRAAIVALGIAIGHHRLAQFAGLNHRARLVQEASTLRKGTTLDGREDWARHFCLSAALAVLENPFIGDSGGLIKEQLDMLTHGSGFSFGDLAADRAGVRFAKAATASATSANAIQARLHEGYSARDYFPPASDLPENLTLEQFRADYGRVGDPRYRIKLNEIDSRLDLCRGLSIP